MLSKNENIKVGVGVSRSAGSKKSFDQSSTYSLQEQIVSALSIIYGKREEIIEKLEQVTFPVSLLLLLIIPILLLCLSGQSFAILWLAIPFILISIASGVLLFIRRAKETRLFDSIIDPAL